MMLMTLADRRHVLNDSIEASRERCVAAALAGDAFGLSRAERDVTEYMRARLDLDRWCVSLGPSGRRGFYVDTVATA